MFISLLPQTLSIKTLSNQISRSMLLFFTEPNLSDIQLPQKSVKQGDSIFWPYLI